MPGPPKKPTALKLVQGTDRPDRRSKSEPMPEVKAPSCPSWLSPAAKREWKRIVPILIRNRVLTEMDRGLLAAYCDAYGRAVEMAKVVAREGFSCETHNGSTIQHPVLGSYHKALEHLHKFGNEFGLSPASRARIPTVEEAKEESSFDEFL